MKVRTVRGGSRRIPRNPVAQDENAANYIARNNACAACWNSLDIAPSAEAGKFDVVCNYCGGIVKRMITHQKLKQLQTEAHFEKLDILRNYPELDDRPKLSADEIKRQLGY